MRSRYEPLLFAPMQPLTDYALLTSFPNEEAVRPLPLYLPYLLTLSLSPRRYGPHYKLALAHPTPHRRRRELPRHAIAAALSDPTLLKL
jgi:hypothetical protein